MTSRVRTRFIIIGAAMAITVSTLLSAISPFVPSVYADTATAVDFNQKNLAFIRVNRTLIKIGDANSGVAYFYSSDPAGENKVYNGVGLTCAATLTYHPASGVEGDVSPGGSSTWWTITWQSPYESQEGCKDVKDTVTRDDDPKNNGENERLWTVFYKDGDKINSVLGNNKITFTQYKNPLMPKDTPNQYVYIEDGIQAVDCPSVIRYSEYDKKWAYMPMTRASSENNASDQYKTLMNTAFNTPVNDVVCTPVDKDDLGLLKRFGLPESYYDRGAVNVHNIQTHFGFSGEMLYGAELLGGVPGVDASGLAANGPNPNGAGIGNGKGVVNEEAAEAAAETTTCTVEGIGWIVCPVMNFMAGLNDVLYATLINFLDVDPAIFGNDTNNGLYGAWNVFRGYANILFIIAFLIIIYSQVTSAGITNYGIKKLLPKLIVAAILVNTSYYLCQIAVDISNILGYGLKTLFEAIGGGIQTTTDASSDSSWTYWVGTAVAATAAAGGLVALALAISVPVVLAALLALLTVVLILIVRQAIIILLIAVSPLAFVAWLLPNTEKWFKKWWDLFFAMLMLFPIVSALFGAGALASIILGGLDFGDDGGTAKIAALGAAVLPLILTIPVLQNSLKATGALGAKLNGWSSKANAKIGNKVKTESKLGRAWAGGMANRASKRADNQNRALAKGRYRWAAGMMGGRGYGATLQDRAAQAEDKDHREGVERATTGLVGLSDSDILSRAQDSKQSAAVRQAAVSHLLQKGTFEHKQQALEAAADIDDTRARTALADEYAKSDISSLYGKSLAGEMKTAKANRTQPFSLERTLKNNYGNISAQTLGGNKDYAQAVKESARTATDDQKEHLMNVLNQIDSNPNINPTSATQAHLDELTDHLTAPSPPPTSSGSSPPPTSP